MGQVSSGFFNIYFDRLCVKKDFILRKEIFKNSTKIAKKKDIHFVKANTYETKLIREKYYLKLNSTNEIDFQTVSYFHS